jgi:uncharacterized protein (DUF1499 family)
MSSKIQWWSRSLVWIAWLVLILFPVAVLGYKFGMLDLLLSFGLLRVVVIGGALVLVAGVGTAIVAKIKANSDLLKSSLVSVAIVALPLIIMGLQISKATSVPPIHDITTDTQNPPVFDQAIQLRGAGSNTLDYGTEALPADKLSAMQLKAYPGIKTIYSELSVDDAFDRAVETATSIGLEVINTDRTKGIIEAVATSFWFGFKDDLVVRLQPHTEGSAIDLRSVSRVGQSDLGANARRIEKFTREFNQ